MNIVCADCGNIIRLEDLYNGDFCGYSVYDEGSGDWRAEFKCEVCGRIINIIVDADESIYVD